MKQDREAVKTLAISIGVREAARRLGLNEDTVCSWAKREAWFTPKPLPPSQAIVTQALQAKPSGALTDVMAERKVESGKHLSKYIVDASERLSQSKGNLKLAKVGRDVVAMRSGTWPAEQGQAGFSLNVLNLGQLQIGIRNEQGEEPGV